MCTSTVAVADALPGQPARAMSDSAVARSGICTSVPLVAAHPVGLGVGGGLGLGVGVDVGVGVWVGVGVGGLRLRIQESMRPTSAAAASWTRSFQLPLRCSEDRFSV